MIPSILPTEARSLIRWMLTVKTEERAIVEDIANHWWLNLNRPKATESKPCASTLPRKKQKERTLISNSSFVLLSPLESSSHNQPTKGILKNLDGQGGYIDSPGAAGNGTAVTNEDVEKIRTGNGRKRKGILKCNGKFSGVSPITSAPTWSHGFGKTSQECDRGEQQEMEFEIKISLWKTHESTGLHFPQNSYFDHVQWLLMHWI